MRTACYGGVIAQRRSESSFFLKFLILQSQFDLMSISCYLLLEYLFHTARYFLVIVIFLLSDVVRKKMLYHNSGIKIFEMTFSKKCKYFGLWSILTSHCCFLFHALLPSQSVFLFVVEMSFHKPVDTSTLEYWSRHLLCRQSRRCSILLDKNCLYKTDITSLYKT